MLIYRLIVLSLSAVLTVGTSGAGVPSFGRIVGSDFSYVPSPESDGSYILDPSYDQNLYPSYDQKSRTTFFIEVTNVADVANCKASLVYGTASESDISLATPAVVTTSQIKQAIWSEIYDYWNINGYCYWQWDDTINMSFLRPVQEAFETVEDYAAYYSRSLMTDDDIIYEIDSVPATNRCWIAVSVGYNRRFNDSFRSLAVTIDEDVEPLLLRIRGSQVNNDTIPGYREDGIYEYGYISPEYGSKALGVDFVCISNAYWPVETVAPSAGGADFGSIFVCFGGTNALSITFNAPCAGSFIFTGTFPYDYSYLRGNSSLNWTTDTPGAVVHNLRPAVSAGATGSRAFTHLFQLNLVTDHAGPCTLKSPIANDITYAAIPRKADQAAPSYPGKISTDSNGNQYGYTTLAVRFVPSNTNYLDIVTTSFEKTTSGMTSHGRVTASKCWLLGETVKIVATPYDDYEFDYWEVSDGVQLPKGIDIHDAMLEFVADETLCGTVSDNPRISLKAHWKKSCVAALPTSYANKLLASGTFQGATDADKLKNAVSMNGKNTVGECYVCGVDPEDSKQEFVSKIEVKDGKPVITWSPELTSAEAALRKYTIWGSTDLNEWLDVGNGDAKDYRFFKVTVEMR